MQLADYHVHSIASSDAEDTMLAMALASGELGVETLCFTDHCDLDNYLTGEFDPDYDRAWPEILAQYEEALREAPAALDIFLGLELGEATHYPDMAREIASRPELDFVLASTHNLRGTRDFYALKYESEAHCLALLEKYLDELIETAALDCFDVLAHIGYTRRYMLRAGFLNADISANSHREKLELLFKRLIENGKGIELNCSGLRHPGIAGPIPRLDVVKLYRELGGEIITIGTDAHRAQDAGHWIREGYELLKEAGFRYVTLYRGRKPEFVRL